MNFNNLVVGVIILLQPNSLQVLDQNGERIYGSQSWPVMEEIVGKTKWLDIQAGCEGKVAQSRYPCGWY